MPESTANDAPATALANSSSPAPAKPKGKGHGQPGKSGPPGNGHAMKSGVFARVLLTRMPARFKGIQRAANDFRAAIETACRELHGGISIPQALAINTATLNERLGRLWSKRLADEYEKMDHAAVSLATNAVAKHAAARDAAVASLRLDKAKDDIWASIYRRPPFPAPALPASKANTIPASPATPSASKNSTLNINAATGSTGDASGQPPASHPTGQGGLDDTTASHGGAATSDGSTGATAGQQATGQHQHKGD